jgi:hypothetical protein
MRSLNPKKKRQTHDGMTYPFARRAGAAYRRSVSRTKVLFVDARTQKKRAFYLCLHLRRTLGRVVRLRINASHQADISRKFSYWRLLAT